MGQIFFCDRCTASVNMRSELQDIANWNGNIANVCKDCYEAYKNTIDPFFEFLKDREKVVVSRIP